MAASAATPKELNTHHALKLLALVTMTIDHLGANLYPDAYWLRAIGHVAVPVWFFLIGAAPHAKLSKDIWLWAAVLAVLNPFLGHGLFPLNVLVTLGVSHWLLGMIDQRDLLNREPWVLIVAALILLLPSFVLMEYGSEGFLYALMGYAVRKGKMDWRRGKAVTVAALLAYLTMQVHAYAFDRPQVLFLIAGATLVTIYLAQYEYRPLKRVPKWIAKPSLYWSRHSMQYYVLHRIVLQVIGMTSGILNPALRII